MSASADPCPSCGMAIGHLPSCDRPRAVMPTFRVSIVPGDVDSWVQMNVRVRRTMLTALDARRAALDGMSRDQWVRNVIEWALLQPPGSFVHDRK